MADFFRTLLASATLVVAGMLPAFATERTQLAQRGDWILDLVEFDNGITACESRTGVRSGTIFTLRSDGTGFTMMSMYDPAWGFGDEPADEIFSLRVGSYLPKRFDATKQDSRIWAMLNESSAEISYLNQLYNAKTLRVISRNGIEITRFSLDGAAYVLSNMEKCKTEQFQ